MLVFCVVNANDEHTKPWFKTNSFEIKFKDSISLKLCLKLWFESDWYFCSITESYVSDHKHDIYLYGKLSTS